MKELAFFFDAGRTSNRLIYWGNGAAVNFDFFEVFNFFQACVGIPVLLHTHPDGILELSLTDVENLQSLRFNVAHDFFVVVCTKKTKQIYLCHREVTEVTFVKIKNFRFNVDNETENIVFQLFLDSFNDFAEGDKCK